MPSSFLNSAASASIVILLSLHYSASPLVVASPSLLDASPASASASASPNSPTSTGLSTAPNSSNFSSSSDLSTVISNSSSSTDLSTSAESSNSEAAGTTIASNSASITAMTLSMTTITTATATPNPFGDFCNEDNCLRALEQTTADAFCSSWLATSVGPTASVPTWLSGCDFTPNAVYHASSGCSCYQKTASA
ncbi:hypothetical protein ACMFMG_009044 [Clarireedia jacksonii]